jgi:hypothetical protein
MEFIEAYGFLTLEASERNEYRNLIRSPEIN